MREQPGEGHVGELAREEVGGEDARQQRDQRARPDPLQLNRRHLTLGRGVEQPLAQRREQALLAAQVRPGGTVERDRLQQRHQAGQILPADLLDREIGRPVGSHEQCRLRDELGQVDARLQVAGGHVAVARVEQDDLAAREHDPVGGQGTVRDPVLVQPQYRVPHLPELVVGRGRARVGQRRAVYVVRGDRRRVGPTLVAACSLVVRTPASVVA